jgi:adenylate cyclase, class 2
VASGNTETEIKLPIENSHAIEERLAACGFRVTKARVFESNTVFDDINGGLRSRGCLLRLREVAGRTVVTFKNQSQSSKHKSREELETTMGDGGIGRLIFERLGLRPTFRYEKYRTEYERPQEHGVVTIDETPIGWFLELEGAPDWIDRTAADLGFDEKSYITDSYGALYLTHCKEKKAAPSNMVFISSP